MKKRPAGVEPVLPVRPSALESDDVLVLKWIGDAPRECVTADLPPAMQFGRMAACRRKLVRMQLATLDCPPGLPCVYLLTADGEKLVAEVREKERPKRVGRKVKVIRRKAKDG